MKPLMTGALAGSLFVVGAAGQAPRVHDLPLTPEHVHWGYYDSRVPPALRVASGDRVRVETMVAGGLARRPSSSVRASRCRPRRFSDRAASRRPRSSAGFRAGRPAGTAAIWTTRI